MIVECAEISARIGIEPFVQQLRDRRSLDLERTRRDIHHLVQTVKEFLFVLRKIRDTGKINRHDADRTGALSASEKPAGLLPKFAKIEAEPAAHTADIARSHIAVNIVREVRSPVLGRHLEKKTIVLRVGPVEILRDRIRRDRVLEPASVGVAVDHDLDKRTVHQIHFFLAVLIFKFHFLAADDTVLLGEIRRHHPIKRNVGERGLRSPSARRVDAVNKGLDRLLDLFVGKIICLHKSGQIRVERGERLRTRPFVLHNAEKIDHLVAKRRQVLGRRRSNLPGNTAEPVLN